MFYVLLWRILHLILLLWSCIVSKYHRLKGLFPRVSLWDSSTSDETSDLGSCAYTKTFKKLPRHVGIVIVENEIFISDLARMAFWCMALGISNVSIYDNRGKKLL